MTKRPHWLPQHRPQLVQRHLVGVPRGDGPSRLLFSVKEQVDFPKNVNDALPFVSDDLHRTKLGAQETDLRMEAGHAGHPRF